MIGIVYSKLDVAGVNMASHVAEANGFGAIEEAGPLRYESKEIRIYEVEMLPFDADLVDGFGCDAIVFLSRHKSEAEVDAFTTHSLGNWRPSAEFGGKPKQLSTASPVLMLAALKNLSAIGNPVEKTYEATHHGPLLKTPSIFVEVGGSDRMVGNKRAAAEVANAALASIASVRDNSVEFSKVAVGIGSTHYPEKFSRLALSNGYAFSHIMPKYAVLNEDGSNNLDVLDQALERSSPRPECAVIDWKSLNSPAKEQTIKKLNEIGLDNEKV
ncbi:MAG: hypothetical protein KGI04_03025 [Candidatus Micrarchaeota archaeon]|nr:hypothetical protein [Candidatus Micrarchaeota archaeon]